MKKIISLLFITVFSLSLFGQSLLQTEIPKSQEFIQKKEAEIARLQELQQGVKMQEAQIVPIRIKGLDKSNNITADPVTFWTNDFEGDVSEWQNVDLTETPIYIEPSDYNAWEGLSWWCGTESPAGWVGYGNNWYQTLTTIDPIDLSSASSGEFSFVLAYDVETDWDFIYVEASADGVTWDELDEFTGFADWNFYDYDLADYVGGNVWVRLLFVSDGSYSDEDGLNPTDYGAFQADNFSVVIDGVETLIDNADDVIGMVAASQEPVGAYWTLVSNTSASGSHSFHTLNYVSDALFALVSEPVDLSDITPGSTLFLDFMVNAQGLYSEEASFGVEDYYFIQLSSDGGLTWVGINNFGYQNTNGWVSWRNTYGANVNTDMSEYLGETVHIRWVFKANNVGKDAASATSGLYIDDPKVLVLSDPYEPNNTPATATVINLPFASEGALWAPGDVDYYTFTASAGQWINIYIDNSNLDMEVLVASLYGTGTTPSLWLIPGDPNGAYYADWVPYDQVFINTYTAGSYILRVRHADWQTTSDAGEYKIYVYSPDPYPDFHTMVDIPNDQGLQLRGTWDHSDFVDPIMIPWQARVEKYHMERRSGLSTWSYLATVPVIYNGTNNTNWTFPTLQDNSPTVFKVIAEANFNTSMVHPLMQHPAYPWMEAPRTLYERGFKYFADVSSGTSIDNIDPVILGGGAEYVSGGVKVYWEVESAPDLLRYVVKRSPVSGQEGEVIFETENLTQTSFVDTDGLDREYFYVVEVHDDGFNVAVSKEFTPTVTSVEDQAVPTVYSLGQNYPNPFNPSTTIKFGLPVNSNVTVKIFDILGQEVANLINSDLAAGFHTINFDASQLHSGMYIYRIQAQGIDGNNFVDAKKMLLVK